MRQLPGQPVNRISMFIGAIVGAAFLVWINFFPGYFGYVRGIGRPLVIYPVLLPVFGRYLVRLNVLWGGGILLNLTHVVTGRWTLLTFLVDVLLQIYGIFLLAQMAAGPTFLAPEWLGLLVRVALGFAVIGLVAALIVRVLAYSRASKRPAAAPPQEADRP
ncbi:MAG: hypothetical protein ACYC6L_08585 [Anaerolineae bacterium]